MQTKFIAIAIFSATSVFAAGPQEKRQNLDDAKDIVNSIAGDATSVLATGAASIGDVIASGVGSHWSHATSAINSIDDSLESKWSTVSGWNTISADLHNAIASGPSGVASFFSTQTAIVGPAASSIQSEATAAIIAAAATATASTTASGNAAPTNMVFGAAMGVVGIVAGALVL